MKKVTWQRIGAAALAVRVWQAASMAVGSALLLPSPAAVLVRLAALLPDGGFWRAVWFSFCRIAGGFGAALVLLIVGYAVSDGTSGYSIADIANQPFYLIAVGVMVIALLLSLVMIQNEKQLPRGMRPE